MIRSLFSKSTGTMGASMNIPEPIIFKKVQKHKNYHMLQSKMLNKRVVVNVGGERHEVMWRTLEQIPYSRLGGTTGQPAHGCAGKLAAAGSHEAVMEHVDHYSLIGNTRTFW